MKTNNKIPIDDRLYTVVGINGFRKSNLTRSHAFHLAEQTREQMKRAGWRGEVKVYYRDGSEVKEDNKRQ